MAGHPLLTDAATVGSRASRLDAAIETAMDDEMLLRSEGEFYALANRLVDAQVDLVDQGRTTHHELVAVIKQAAATTVAREEVLAQMLAIALGKLALVRATPTLRDRTT